MPTRSGRRYTTGEVITPELIPGLPNDVVLTHVLPHFLDPVELARLSVMSRAMNDAVSEIVWRWLWRRAWRDAMRYADVHGIPTYASVSRSLRDYYDEMEEMYGVRGYAAVLYCCDRYRPLHDPRPCSRHTQRARAAARAAEEEDR